MTRNATPATTGATPMPRGTALRALVAAAVVVGSAWFATPALAGLGEPVDPRDTTEPREEPTTSTTEADGPSTTAEDDGPASTTTEAKEDDDEPADEVDGDAASSSSDADDEGTSIAALAAVGVIAFILGLLVAAVPLGALLSKRKAAGTAPASPASSGGPAIGPAPSRDTDQVRQQRVALVEALIGLRDKLPSEALSAEAAQALAAAGIHEVRPEGVPFDPAHHRAVHQVSTDDPARHNTVASVERPGYSDGVSTIRQPEVVVAVHGGSS